MLILVGVAPTPGATIAVGLLTLGYFHDDAPGGGVLLLMGDSLNILLGLGPVALVVGQRHLAARAHDAGPTAKSAPTPLM